jgi:hypothetical protein
VRIVDPVAADQPPARDSICRSPGYLIEVNTDPRGGWWATVCICETLMEARRVANAIIGAIAAEVGQRMRGR